MKNMKPVISVIVPVYNRAYCVPVCLESIKNQSFTDWECIVVDDGSIDNSVSVCLSYAESDTRFKVIIQSENLGVSMARNHGLDLARGEYIAFIDSDDWIEPVYLESLYKVARDKTMPLCSMDVFNYQRILSETFKLPDKCYKLDNSVEELLFMDNIGCPVCRLYQRNILEQYHIRYIPNVNLGEDRIFNFTYFKYIDYIKCLPSRLYHVCKQQISLTMMLSADESSFDFQKLSWDAMYAFLVSKNISTPKIESFINARYWNFVYNRITFIFYNSGGKTTIKERFIIVRRIVKQVDKERAKKKKLGLKNIKLKAVLMEKQCSSIIWLLYECKYFYHKLKRKFE